ncbi:MAG: glycosyltransferase [Planctomycetota bacterium]
MRIAVLTSLYPGPSRPHEGLFAERRWRGMAARGHAVLVVQPLPRTPGRLARGRWAEIRDLPPEEERGGVLIRRPRYWHVPRWALANARRFVRAGLSPLLAEGRPDVAVADYAWPAAAAAAALAARGVPFVVNGRGSDVLEVAERPRLAPALAAALRAAGHWCAVSWDLVAAMDRLAGREGGGRLVANGVDLDLFAPGDRRAARTALGLEEAGSLVLVVGHLIERKDPFLALAAFARGAPPDARLVFVGRGPLRGALERAIAAAGLAGRARVAGEVAPAVLCTWYAAADALLLTSSREGRPNVVLESLACGRPIVATAAGGTAECLGDLAAGLLVRSREPADVAARLARVLAAPPAPDRLRQAVAHLSWEKSLDALERCLEDARAAAR